MPSQIIGNPPEWVWDTNKHISHWRDFRSMETMHIVRSIQDMSSIQCILSIHTLRASSVFRGITAFRVWTALRIFRMLEAPRACTFFEAIAG